MKKTALRFIKWNNKGQSFVELAIVMFALMALLFGMVEAGNLLNLYINLVDGAKEGARSASGHNPFKDSANGDFSVSTEFYTNIDGIIEGTWNTSTSSFDGGSLAPVTLNSAVDDIVISIFTVNDTGLVVQQTFPKYADVPAANQLTGCDCWSVYKRAVSSRVKRADIEAHLNAAGKVAPGTGILVVEIFYTYNTILRLPPTIPVHTYSIMPLSAAEPTPIP